jgi:hypothetical protein
MKLEIDQEKNEVVIRMPLRTFRHGGHGGKPTTITDGEEQIEAPLDGHQETFRVRASVDYHGTRKNQDCFPGK